MPHCVDAGTHTDAPSAVSPTDSLQWRASSCNDRLCLTLISARPPHHKTHFLSYPDNRCFSVRLRGRFSVPTCRTAPRRAQKAVKAGRRPPPQAAQCGLDGREHGVTLNQVGSARFLSRHPIRKGWLTDLPPARLPPAALFACQNGRKSHHPSIIDGTGPPHSPPNPIPRFGSGFFEPRVSRACRRACRTAPVWQVLMRPATGPADAGA